VLGGVIGLPSFFNIAHWLSGYLSGVTSVSEPILYHSHPLSHVTEIILMSVAGAGAIIIILIARYRYVSEKHIPAAEASLHGLQKLVYHKFYVDELYDLLITKPIFRLSTWFGGFIDKQIVDRTVNLFADAVSISGRTLRLIQSGNTGAYVFAMVIGMIVLFIIRLLI
jgi:NADH-quinone oxidoreductase subunit L